MLDFYSLLILKCDTYEGDEDTECWKETTFQIREGEKKNDAIKLAKEMGWEFVADNYHQCPFCSKGIIEGNLKVINGGKTDG